MNELKEKFLALSTRDQLMLVGGAALVLIYILVFVLLFPMQDRLDKSQQRVKSSLEEQSRVRHLAGQVLGLQQNGGGAGQQGINALLNESLGRFGLRMENFQPSGNTARVRLASAEFNQVLAWLHELEINQGLQVKDLTLTADKNPGAVLVNVQLQQGE